MLLVSLSARPRDSGGLSQVGCSLIFTPELFLGPMAGPLLIPEAALLAPGHIEKALINL